MARADKNFTTNKSLDHILWPQISKVDFIGGKLGQTLSKLDFIEPKQLQLYFNKPGIKIYSLAIAGYKYTKIPIKNVNALNNYPVIDLK